MYLCAQEKKKKEKSVTLFKVSWFVSGDLKLLQGKPSVHYGESGYKLAKPLTGGTVKFGIERYLFFGSFGSLALTVLINKLYFLENF